MGDFWTAAECSNGTLEGGTVGNARSEGRLAEPWCAAFTLTFEFRGAAMPAHHKLKVSHGCANPIHPETRSAAQSHSD